jgi:sugar lactone lactonase YvrE
MGHKVRTAQTKRFDPCSSHPAAPPLTQVKLPMNNPTSCAIGGANMDTLFITTARHRLSEEERAKQPGAGQLWAVKLRVGVWGLPEPHFARPSPVQ